MESGRFGILFYGRGNITDGDILIKIIETDVEEFECLTTLYVHYC